MGALDTVKEEFIMSTTLIENLLKALEEEYQEELRSCNELIQSLGGKCLVQLELDLNGASGPFPPCKLRVGDIVLVQPDTGPLTSKENVIEATIFRMTDLQVTLVLSETFPSFMNSRSRILRLSNETSYQRMKAVLQDLLAESSPSTWSQLFLTPSTLSNPTPPYPKLIFRHPNLNESQKSAIQFCLATQQLGLIHGPPGTGKTETLVELIQQLVKRGDRVLVCGPSNLSVDNIIERLSKTSCTSMIRLGHPAKVSESILPYTLDIRLRNSDQGQLIHDMTKEMDGWIAKLRKTRRSQESRAIYQEIRTLRKEMKKREKKMVLDVLQQTKVVLATLNGAASKKLVGLSFDSVVIDEAAQALEPDCWLAIQRATRAVLLAGDHCQLPPTVQVAGSCLSATLFERLVGWYPGSVRTLEVQYRMHHAIMEFPNKYFYAGVLQAHESVARRTVCGLPPLVVVDTLGEAPEQAGTDGEPQGVVGGGGVSRSNTHEVERVVRHVHTVLLDAGVPPQSIVVLTPYLAQVRLLRNALPPTIEVGTVDAMQGRENDAVVLSLVRSNERREIGFLSEARRLNTAVTRAKSHLCVVADVETVSASPFCKGLMDHIMETGEVYYD